MVGKWNAAVLAMAWMCSAGARSASVRGIAVKAPLFKSGTAWGITNDGSRSGLRESLRYRVHQLVSNVSCIRFVSLRFPLDPVALLPGRVRNLSRFTDSAPFDMRYAFRKFW